MIDISDGLSLDLYHITDTSNVGAIIYDDSIPISQNANSKQDALSGGEDFELLFTTPRNITEEKLSKKLGIQVKKIGEIVPKRAGIRIEKEKDKKTKFSKAGYTHF